MNMLKYKDVINACRFCFMCRHLDTVGNVTFKEADTPRGRALILDKICMYRKNLKNPDFVDTIYKCALSAACRHHCVSHYDETGLVLAARRDITAAGFEPEKVRQLATELKANAGVELAGGSGEIIYYVDSYSAAKQPEIAEAFRLVLAAAGVSCRILTGDSGKALLTLGYRDPAKAVAVKLRDAVAESGCNILVTSCPASLDAFKNDYPELGVAFDADIRILHTAEFMLELLEHGKLKAGHNKKDKVCYLASDFLKNYNQLGEIPLKLLQKIGAQTAEFGTNREESYAAGEGAVVYDRLQPKILKLLCNRIASLADSPATDILLTVSPYTKYALATFSEKKLNVISLEEFVAERITTLAPRLKTTAIRARQRKRRARNA
ncbi:MAG: (Fe-S)-binding protein [Kiritimatiellae bacterium]|nr:(Fe-S)-binding protein [Kiritimatiellia bacterium]